MTVVASPAAASPRVLTLLAHVDATPSDLEPYEVAEVDAFEKAWRPDTQVRVQLSRTAGPSPAGKIALGLLEIAAVPASLALLPALGPLGLAVCAGAYALCFDGGQRLGEGIRGAWMHREPAWDGTRVYDMAPDRKKGRIDSPVIAQADSPKPDRLDLARFIADGMNAYPSQVTAFMASGHGLAYEGTVGHSVESLRKALTQAAVLSGRKPDVIVLESCLMGNLEALDRLKNTARYAVVSEETMGAAGLPWKQILSTLPEKQMSPEVFGRTIVEASREAKGIDTVALVDLQKLPVLTARVNDLAVELRRVVADGGKSEVGRALRRAESFPHTLNPLSRFSFDVRDLGQIAGNVRQGVADEGARKAAEAVEKALGDAVVASASKKRYRHASHLSIQGTRPRLDAGAYAEQTGFGEWAGLLADLRR